METWSRPIHHNHFHFAVVARNRGPAGHSAISTRLFRTNFNEAARLQLTDESARVSARFSAARRRVSHHARTRDETVCRLSVERRHASLLAWRQHWQRLCDLPSLVVGKRIYQCRLRNASGVARETRWRGKENRERPASNRDAGPVCAHAISN